jgi:hypothetical protein
VRNLSRFLRLADMSDSPNDPCEPSGSGTQPGGGGPSTPSVVKRGLDFILGRRVTTPPKQVAASCPVKPPPTNKQPPPTKKPSSSTNKPPSPVQKPATKKKTPVASKSPAKAKLAPRPPVSFYSFVVFPFFSCKFVKIEPRCA